MTGEILWPNGTLTEPRVSSGFGPRKAPTGGASTQHRGTDFTGFALVRAVADGVVVAVGTPSGWGGGGRQVWIQHQGFLTRYLHLKNTPAVRVGESVTAGRILGVMGMTGTATGVHLHFEVVVGGLQVDSVPFIRARLAATAANSTPSTTTPKENPMKPLLFQIDPRVDGRWVVVNVQGGTYWRADNGAQLDFLRATGTVVEVHGAQPPAVIAGMKEARA